MYWYFMKISVKICVNPLWGISWNCGKEPRMFCLDKCCEIRWIRLPTNSSPIHKILPIKHCTTSTNQRVIIWFNVSQTFRSCLFEFSKLVWNFVTNWIITIISCKTGDCDWPLSNKASHWFRDYRYRTPGFFTLARIFRHFIGSYSQSEKDEISESSCSAWTKNLSYQNLLLILPNNCLSHKLQTPRVNLPRNPYKSFIAFKYVTSRQDCFLCF